MEEEVLDVTDTGATHSVQQKHQVLIEEKYKRSVLSELERV